MRVVDSDRAYAITSWPLFPFEGDLRLKRLGPLLEAELPRAGEGGQPCARCTDPLKGVIWGDERWVVSAGPRSACPVTVFLETRDHVDLDLLSGEMATELGVLIVRLEAAVRAVPNCGRVHIHRWSDGSAHLHFWFMARPARRLEMYGWGNELWSQLLPPIEQTVFDANLGIIRTALESPFAETT